MDLEAEGMTRLAKALSQFSPTILNSDPAQVFDEAMASRYEGKLLNLDASAGILDCHGHIKGLGDFRACNERSTEVDLGGFTIRVLTREALIEAKKAMGRPKDLLTVAQLEIGGGWREFDGLFLCFRSLEYDVIARIIFRCAFRP